MRGDLAASRDCAEAAVDFAERLGDAASLGPALATLAMVDFLCGRGLDHRTIERAAALEPEIERVRMVEARPAWLHALLLSWSDDLERAQTILERLRRGWSAVTRELRRSFSTTSRGSFSAAATGAAPTALRDGATPRKAAR
jgi:hypothetical protein